MMITKRPTWVQSLNADGRYGVALAALLTTLLLPALGGDRWLAAWKYDRDALRVGEWWRLLAAHAVHLDLHHLLFNAAGLALLWMLFARSWRPVQWLAVVGVSIGAIDAGLWWLSPGVQWYAGASGVLHGIWAAGAFGEWRRRGVWYWLPAVLLAGKLVTEQWRGESLVVGGLPVVLVAHVYGALGGVLLPLLWQLRQSRPAASV
jgi:rhomboid family GlyGly-CTERM serine protease